jgi:hypothetical protein
LETVISFQGFVQCPDSSSNLHSQSGLGDSSAKMESSNLGQSGLGDSSAKMESSNLGQSGLGDSSAKMESSNLGQSGLGDSSAKPESSNLGQSGLGDSSAKLESLGTAIDSSLPIPVDTQDIQNTHHRHVLFQKERLIYPVRQGVCFLYPTGYATTNLAKAVFTTYILLQSQSTRTPVNTYFLKVSL